MRAVFVEKTKDDRVTVAEGTFDRVDAEDSWADLIVIAQVSLFRPLVRSFGNQEPNTVCRHSIGARIMKKPPTNLLESSNPKARWLSSGTWKTGTWGILTKVAQSSSSIDSSHSATWVAKARDIIEAHEAGTPQFRLGASNSHHSSGGFL